MDAIRRRDLKAAVKAVPSLAQFLAEESADDATVAMTAMDVAAEPIKCFCYSAFRFWWSFLAGADDGADSSHGAQTMRPVSGRVKATPAPAAKRGSNVWMWVALLLAIVLIAGGIWTVLSSNNGGDSSDPAPSASSSVAPTNTGTVSTVEPAGVCFCPCR